MTCLQRISIICFMDLTSIIILQLSDILDMSGLH